jgi:spore germination protein PF
MATFFNPVEIVNIGGGAVVQFGPALFISSKAAAKSTHGSGSSNTGARIINVNGISATNTGVSDLIDQPVIADA